MTGMKLVMTEDMNYRNTSIVGLAAALGMGVSQASASLSAFPEWVTTIFGKSPVVIATLVAIFLNVTLPKEKERLRGIHRQTSAAKKDSPMKFRTFQGLGFSRGCLLF